MCPACYATLAWTILGWTTAGSAVTVAIAKVFGVRKKRLACPKCVDQASD